MDTMGTTLVICAIVTFLGSIGGCRALMRRHRHLRVARRVARATIAEAPEGTRVRIVATIATSSELLYAPITGRRCVAYDATVEMPSGTGWAPIAREGRTVVATVSDGSGTALVELAGADLDAEASLRIGTIVDDHPPTRALLVRCGMAGVPPGTRLRFRERALEVGTEIAVTGVAVREPDPAAPADVTGYRDHLPTRLHFSSPAHHPIHVTDDHTALD